MINKIYILTILIVLYSTTSIANSVSNGFLVEKKYFDFSKNMRKGLCKGTIPFPDLSNSDQELINELNSSIYDFVQIYSICNKGHHNHYSVEYNILHSNINDFFSVKWSTSRNKQLWRIDVLSFNRNTGALVEVKDIFNPFSKHLMNELKKLSDGHLSRYCSWKDFLDKVKKRDVQFYIKDKEWFIIFNATKYRQDVIDVKLPNFFLKGGDHD